MAKIITNELKGNGIDARALEQVRDVISSIMDKAYDKRLDRYSMVSRLAVSWFLENNTMDEHLVSILNKLKGERNIQGALDAFALRMTLKRELVNHILSSYKAVFFLEYTKLVLGGMIIDALGELGYIETDTRESKHLNQVTGRRYTVESNWYVFQEKVTTMFDPITGLPGGVYTEPGELGATKLKLNSWERTIKFNGEQKQFLRDVASVGWSVIKRPKEWWIKYFKSSEWYVQAYTKKIEDKILLNERVEELANGILVLSEMPRLYHSYGFSLSGRLIAQLTTVGVAPHGDGKLIWQYADDRTITKYDVSKAQEHLVKLRDGAMSESQASAIWEKNSYDILHNWAKGDHSDMMKGVYIEGLIEIIDKGIGGTSKRFVGEDLSTDGIGIFASNFRSKKMAKASNIGGHKNYYDAHTMMGDVFGIKDRKQAKLINAGLFHGENIKNIAKKVHMSPAIVRAGLIEGFGIRATYFNRIARHVGSMIDNMHTSTRMQSPEGWYFVNQAYAQRSVVKIVFPVLGTDSKTRTVEVIRDMPLLFPVGGGMPQNILYENKDRKDLNGILKMSGGYANSIHMLGAWTLREVLRRCGYDILTVHDNYFCTGLKLQSTKRVVKACHVKMWKHNYLLGNINYMGQSCGREISPLILSVGDLAKSNIISSDNFMQP